MKKWINTKEGTVGTEGIFRKSIWINQDVSFGMQSSIIDPQLLYRGPGSEAARRFLAIFANLL
jgi:hypothetical protein